MTDDPQKGRQDKFYGEYIGQVESVSDPERLLRVQVRVIAIHTEKVPTKDLPWAEYKLPIGARVNDGFFTPVDVGDWVWVDFPFDFDPRRPRITGSVHHAPGKVPNFPHEAFAGPNKLTHKVTGEEPIPTAAAYHKNGVFTQHGVTIEINEDTSFTLTQRATGTAARISKEGDITFHGERNIYASAKVKAVMTAPEVTVNATTKYEVNSPIVRMNTASLSMGGGGASAELNGNFKISGDITHAGKLDMTGNIEVDGNIDATGTIIDAAGNTNHHPGH